MYAKIKPNIPSRDSSGFEFCPQMVSAPPAAPRIDGAVVFPTMIEATKTVSFDPSHRQLRAPVRATKADHVWRPGVTAIERKIFSENADRQGASCR